jgi:hypothetical protein
VFVGNNGEKNSSQPIFILFSKINKMSSSQTPPKSGGSRGEGSKTPRAAVGQIGTPPTGSGQRRSTAGSQVGSPSVRSGVASVVSPSGGRDKLSSATQKQNAASPIPSRNNFSKRRFIFS